MDITPLSQVRPGTYTYTICVRISRLWEFHGKNDEEPIKHLDLVLIDEKVIYCYGSSEIYTTNFFLIGILCRVPALAMQVLAYCSLAVAQMP
jgi:hypothetical protein